MKRDLLEFASIYVLVFWIVAANDPIELQIKIYLFIGLFVAMGATYYVVKNFFRSSRSVEVIQLHYKPELEINSPTSTVIDVYVSSVEEDGIFAGVFERDDDTAYLYLVDISNENAKIIGALSVDVINRMPADVPVAIRWHGLASAVGLLVDDDLIALFDLRGAKPIGRYAEASDHSFFRTH